MVKKTAVPKKDTKPSVGDGGDGSGAIDGVKGKVQSGQEVGLTVRIEVNLPPGGDADMYDAIFASIKKNLMS